MTLLPLLLLAPALAFGSQDTPPPAAGDEPSEAPEASPDPHGPSPAKLLDASFDPVFDVHFGADVVLDEGSQPRWTFTRGWIGGRLGISDAFVLDGVVDLSKLEKHAAADQVIARAFLEWHPTRVRAALTVRAGKTWALLVPLENRLGHHRYVLDGWASRWGFVNSRDLGVSAETKLGNGSVVLAGGAWEGRVALGPEGDALPQVAGLVTVRPMPESLGPWARGLRLAVHGLWEARHKEDEGLGHRAGVSTVAALAVDHLHAGVEGHFWTENADRPLDGGAVGLAVFAHPAVPLSAQVLGRRLEFLGLLRVDAVHHLGVDSSPIVDVVVGPGLGIHRRLQLSAEFGVQVEQTAQPRLSLSVRIFS